MGLVAVRLLTGEIYWRGVHTLASLMLVQVCAEPPVPADAAADPGCSAGGGRMVSRGRARGNPSQRFRSVGEQVDALAEALGVRRPVLGAGARGASGVARSGDGLPARPVSASGAMPGTATTTRVLSLGATSTPAAPRPRSSLIAPGLVAVALMGLLAGTWIVRGGLAPREPPAASASTVPRPWSSSVALRPAPTPTVLASAGAPEAVTDGGMSSRSGDAAASSGLAPVPLPAGGKWPPLVQMQIRAPRPRPPFTPFAPTSP